MAPSSTPSFHGNHALKLNVIIPRPQAQRCTCLAACFNRNHKPCPQAHHHHSTAPSSEMYLFRRMLQSESQTMAPSSEMYLFGSTCSQHASDSASSDAASSDAASSDSASSDSASSDSAPIHGSNPWPQAQRWSCWHRLNEPCRCVLRLSRCLSRCLRGWDVNQPCRCVLRLSRCLRRCLRG